MKKDFIVDYLSCITFKLFGSLVRILPMSFGLSIGKIIGELLYAFDLKHRSIAYTNIKTAFANKFLPSEIKGLTREFYRTFGQSLIEIFFIPRFDQQYMDRYIRIEGVDYIKEAFKKGRGVILLAVHAGSWELSNVICANLGFVFNLFARDQRYPRLDALLNSYRTRKGCKVIHRQNQTRGLINALKNNEAIGMTLDQGGRFGVRVKFFGKEASMPSGAVRLALKYDAVILPAYYTRIGGAYQKIIIEPAFLLKKTDKLNQDIHDNIQELTRIFERFILKYPKDYLWTYKIWKYGRESNILILNDGKTGHLRQSQAVAEIAGRIMEEKGMRPKVDTIEIKFRNELSRLAVDLSSCLSDKYNCPGCLWCLKKCLEKDLYQSLISQRLDIIISCGWSVAAINHLLAKENLAKSIVVMRPSFLSTRRFDLAIIPRHDRPRRSKNVVITDGALNLIDEGYLEEQGKMLHQFIAQDSKIADSCIGLLIGGDTKDFSLKKETILEVILQVKSIAQRNNFDILVTTSRRTSADIEDLVKKELQGYPRCKFLVIARERNLLFALGGILALSKIVIVSPESISMISEAASSRRHVIVFKSKVNPRHNYFLTTMAQKKYIYISEPKEIPAIIDRLDKERPQINVLKDGLTVREALKRIL